MKTLDAVSASGINGRSVGTKTLFVAILAILCTAPALGQLNEEQKLIASDGAANDYFGISVSLSGDTALIGADCDDDNGWGSGSAYVFRYDAGSGTWNEEAKLIASDGETYDHFGWSVSLSGDTALIGACGDDDNGSDSGSAFVFRYDTGSGTWNEEAKLTASDGATHDYFGYNLSLTGDIALIGAYGDDDNGSESGSAYVFRYDAGSGTWFEDNKLLASDGAGGDQLGRSVSLSGEVALIGAESGDGNVTDSGAAYVFDVYYPVTVDVKINGQDDTIVVNSTEAVTCTIDIVDNSQFGDLVDIWVLAICNGVRFSFGYYGSATWTRHWDTVYFTGGLFDHSTTVFDTALPNGIGFWTVYLAIDGESNGVIDYSNIMALDSVTFAVVP